MADDPLILYDQTFGVAAGEKMLTVPGSLAGKIKGDALSYTAIDPSATADFLTSLAAQGKSNRSILSVLRKSG